MQDAIHDTQIQGATGHREAVDVRPYGMLAEFDDAPHLVTAARQARDAGYTKLDGYSPFPIEGLSETLGQRDFLVPKIMLAGGALGGFGGFGFLSWATAVDYPLNIGGRPLLAWASFIPITFELTVLLSALSGIAGMFMLNGLPQPYHPLFDAPNFHRASSDKFFLCIEVDDPQYDAAKTKAFLESLDTVRVTEVMLKK